MSPCFMFQVVAFFAYNDTVHHKGTYNHFQQVSTLDMHTNHIYTGIVYQSHCTKYFSGHLCT